MDLIDLVVIFGGAALIGLLAWYFFAPRRAVSAELRGGVQQVDIEVRGGYSPDLVRVTSGRPVRTSPALTGKDNSECTSRVVFPDLRKSVSLAAFDTTAVDLLIEEPGEYPWACGMNMLHGRLIVEPGEGATAGGGEGVTAHDGTADSGRASAETAHHGAPVPASEPPVPRDRGGETARAVGVGPMVERQDAPERAEFLLPGALGSLPRDSGHAEAALRAIPGVDSANVNFGAERAVVLYDPTQSDVKALEHVRNRSHRFPCPAARRARLPGHGGRGGRGTRGGVAGPAVAGRSGDCAYAAGAVRGYG